MLRGRRLAIDVGTKRIGLAITDSANIMATPLATVSDKSEVLSYLADDVEVIYIGLPLNLQGGFTQSTKLAVNFASELQASTEVPVRLIDERMTTSLAASNLRESGHSEKSSRGFIDQASAVVILEAALSMEKASGEYAGKSIKEVQDES